MPVGVRVGMHITYMKVDMCVQHAARCRCNTYIHVFPFVDAHACEHVRAHARAIATCGCCSNTSAQEATGLIISKQLESVGCPVPGSGSGWLEWLLFLYCSDCGSDQVGYEKDCYEKVHKHTASATAGNGHPPGSTSYTSHAEIFIATMCFLHQIHIIVKNSLVLIDLYISCMPCANFSYFSLLAKICHLWRGSVMAVFKTCLKVTGATFAVKHAAKKVNACLSGRWGAIWAVQLKIACFGEFVFKKVFCSAFNWDPGELAESADPAGEEGGEADASVPWLRG